MASTTDRESEVNALVGRALREFDVEQNARNSGQVDKPETASTIYDVTQRKIVDFFESSLREQRATVLGQMDTDAVDRKAIASKIDIPKTKMDFDSLVHDLGPGIAGLKQDHKQPLGEAKGEVERRHRQLRWFKETHGLSDTPAIYPNSLFEHFAWVAVIAVLEWVTLA